MVTEDDEANGFVAADESSCRSCPSLFGSYCASCTQTACLLITSTPVDLDSLAVTSTTTSAEEINQAI